MSKKSGLFYSMLAMMGLYVFHNYPNSTESQFQPEGKVHGSGRGKGITSYGKKRVYPRSTKRDAAKQLKHRSMVQGYARAGITWFSGKLYWNTRKLAEANVGVRTDMIK